MPTALGLTGDDRFAAKVGVIFKVCGAGEVFSHVNNGTTTMDHGSRLQATRLISPKVGSRSPKRLPGVCWVLRLRASDEC